MDVGAFSGEDFDAKDWVNSCFQQPEAQANKEQFASSLVMKLQLMIAKLNGNLEDQCESVSHQLIRPKVIGEVDSLHHEMKLLQAQMVSVQRQLNKTNSETATSNQQLVELDQFKRRIQATCKALKEADNWTTLTTEIEDDLDGGDLQVVATKLTAIQSSLKILTHAPDYEERVIHVEGLKNRLEAMSSPHLVQAFNSNDLTRAQFFVKVFADMDRSLQLLKYYRKCVRAKLVRAQADLEPAAGAISGEDSMRGGEGESQLKDEALVTLQNISSFFRQTVQTVKEQLNWFPQVFPAENGFDHLMEILLDVHTSMDPKIRQLLANAVAQHSENENRKQMEFLISAKRLFNSHAADLDRIFLAGDENNGRLNARMREICKLLYTPFKTYVAKYPALEGKILVEEMTWLNQDTSKDIVDELRNVGGSVSKAIALLETASQRCFALTEGCGFHNLASVAFEMALTTYMERFLNLTKRLDKRKGASHSWLILQQSLTLNQVCGDLLMQLEKLDMSLSQEFLDRTAPFLQTTSERAIHQHDLYLLEGPGAISKLQSFHGLVVESKEFPVCGSLLRSASKTCRDVQSSTFAILFHPIIDHLATVHSPDTIENVWKSPFAGSDSKQADMPEFSFVPQEYITQIGQYLMTLPQHLEPYMSNDNPALTRALRERVFPYCNGGGATAMAAAGGQAPASDGTETPADFLLNCITTATCVVYQENILRIPEVSGNSAKQLHVDIGYLGDILDDLGHSLTDGLMSIVFLLKLNPSEYWSRSTEHPQKLVSAIRRMRNLTTAS